MIQQGKVFLSFGDINDAGTNYRTFTSISQIQVDGFTGVFDSMIC